MNEIQIFNYEGMPVRKVTIDGAPWFVGKDVAEILGYKDTVNALKDHVDNEDKMRWRIATPSRGEQEATVINESGLYSLILSSKLPDAKKFKRWVTSEVLPSIRRTGSYNAGDHRKRMAEFDRAMEQGKEVYLSMGYRGVKLAVALDKIYKDYLGFSALAIAGIDPNEAVAECTPFWVRRILDYMKGHGNVTPNEIAQALGMKHCTAKVQLGRMVQQGYLKKIGFGIYALDETYKE